ncbi:SGNH/GDSL hydrolase family protein [Pontibacter harenae]|uniref:SGNH/GDSL hydrolase family protein n=1 Tax=Pontibacter harenae TaxID=2894083 RepID=UPI001E3A883C|nr:SGNH/GDSL hydrolase family protein [Pontibacter harenae]MCC9167316.1 SGNH/GDSL hydrolase family protein [Pontibacter harenae]
MKNFFYRSGALALFAGVLLTSCDPEIDAPAASAGNATFTSYIAVGNSLTAGYGDGGLYREGQLNSFPAILAQQFSTVGGGEFTQPLFSEEQRNGSGYLRLTGFTAQGSPITANETSALGIRSASPRLYTKYTDNTRNLGVPGIRVADIKTVGYGSTQGNPFFERLTNNPLQTYLQYVETQAQAANHTFFSNWLGNNDVLGYATAGGFSGTLTDVDLFTENYSDLIDVLTADNAEGIVATIPDVTGIPFFTTVGPGIKATLTAAKAQGMVALTGNGPSRTLVATTGIRDAAGGTALFTLTGAAYAPLIGRPGGKYWRDLARQTSPANPAAAMEQFITTYQIDTTQAFGVSVGNPWPSALLLDDAEQAAVQTATTNFNNVIKAEASAHNLAVWDANAYFRNIQTGFTRNGVAYSPAFITGNLFSLDGIHPTPRGYAIIANEMIAVINAKYNANIPPVDETQYRAVIFP